MSNRLLIALFCSAVPPALFFPVAVYFERGTVDEAAQAAVASLVFLGVRQLLRPRAAPAEGETPAPRMPGALVVAEAAPRVALRPNEVPVDPRRKDGGPFDRVREVLAVADYLAAPAMAVVGHKAPAWLDPSLARALFDAGLGGLALASFALAATAASEGYWAAGGR